MTNGDYCVPGNTVPTVKITLGTPFPGVPAGNDPCFMGCVKLAYMAEFNVCTIN